MFVIGAHASKIKCLIGEELISWVAMSTSVFFHIPDFSSVFHQGVQGQYSVYNHSDVLVAFSRIFTVVLLPKTSTLYF